MRVTSSIYKREYRLQYLATFAGTLSILSVGANNAWTSPYLPQITNGTYPGISVTSDEGSWIAIMPQLASPPGALIAAYLVDRIGRKMTTLLMAPITFAMFITMAFARTTLAFCAIRFLIGCVGSILYTALPMYLGEIAHPAIRGILTASVAFSSLLGTLLINVLGFHFSILLSSLICAAIPLVHFLAFIWMPESPYYLIRKNMDETARESLAKLRSTDDNGNEFKMISVAVNEEIANKKARFLDIFTVKSNRFALFVFIILNTTRKFSGIGPFLFYTVSIFQTAEGSVSPHTSVVIFLCIQIISAMVSLNVLDYVGRRPIIIISTVACIITLSISGTYFYCKEYHPDYLQHFGWVPLTVLTIYMVFYNLGLELTPMVYASELFPTNVKASALGVVDVISSCNGIVTLKLFHILTDHYGMYLSFWVFAVCCVVGLVLIVIYVPETKNKTLQEIQQDLSGRSEKA
ncbi:hypothetical protein PPYR_10265 [Photinus pyralis]|uniref:Major facilitator superfamily (MFS) profile domain-containing protein n=1 Tax=Photinus pyralis TaxID=7054 RepID=A0A5N4AFW7_PHOPY|nr:facilitated trehalose transporter Tret1-2 homolog [Photinus pyralis]KAB0796204.1 hypothetical protein PPYR_10265 [Photinus pyralis]